MEPSHPRVGAKGEDVDMLVGANMAASVSEAAKVAEVGVAARVEVVGSSAAGAVARVVAEDF